MLFKIGWLNAMQPHHTAPLRRAKNKKSTCVFEKQSIHKDLIFTLSSEKDKNRNGFYDWNRDSVGAVRVITFWFSPRERIIDCNEWDESESVGEFYGGCTTTMARISESFEKTTRLDQPTSVDRVTKGEHLHMYQWENFSDVFYTHRVVDRSFCLTPN